MRSIAVYCASAEGAQSVYRQEAAALGKVMAQRGIGLVYGGAKVGLMSAVANSVLSHGGHVLGVIPHVLMDKEVAHDGCTELLVVEGMHERKALMMDRADAFLILPGGYGTLEEMFEVLTWAMLKIHAKPVCVLNTAGFYDGLLAFLDHCVTEGVLKPKARAGLLVAATVEDAVRQLEEGCIVEAG